MPWLSVGLSDDELAALHGYAERRRTSVAWLIRDYVDYLLAGGEPVRLPLPKAPTGMELAALSQHGGAFDWLADEPELYSLADGEPV